MNDLPGSFSSDLERVMWLLSLVERGEFEDRIFQIVGGPEVWMPFMIWTLFDDALKMIQHSDEYCQADDQELRQRATSQLGNLISLYFGYED